MKPERKHLDGEPYVWGDSERKILETELNNFKSNFDKICAKFTAKKRKMLFSRVVEIFDKELEDNVLMNRLSYALLCEIVKNNGKSNIQGAFMEVDKLKIFLNVFASRVLASFKKEQGLQPA